MAWTNVIGNVIWSQTQTPREARQLVNREASYYFVLYLRWWGLCRYQLREAPHTNLLLHREEECKHAHVLLPNLGLSTQPNLRTSALLCISVCLVLQNPCTNIRMEFVLILKWVCLYSSCQGLEPSVSEWEVGTGLSQPFGLGSSRFLGGGRRGKMVRVQLCSSCVDYIGNQQPADGGPYPSLLFKKCKEIFHNSPPMLFLTC